MKERLSLSFVHRSSFIVSSGSGIRLEDLLMNKEQSNIHIFSANLGRWLGAALPEKVVEAARAYLREQDSARGLRGAWVMIFGDDLHLHLTTFNGDFPAGDNPGNYAATLARGAALAALASGFKLGLGHV